MNCKNVSIHASLKVPWFKNSLGSLDSWKIIVGKDQSNRGEATIKVQENANHALKTKNTLISWTINFSAETATTYVVELDIQSIFIPPWNYPFSTAKWKIPRKVQTESITAMMCNWQWSTVLFQCTEFAYTVVPMHLASHFQLAHIAPDCTWRHSSETHHVSWWAELSFAMWISVSVKWCSMLLRVEWTWVLFSTVGFQERFHSLIPLTSTRGHKMQQIPLQSFSSFFSFLCHFLCSHWLQWRATCSVHRSRLFTAVPLPSYRRSVFITWRS